MISEVYRPVCVRSFRQHAGHIECRRDPGSCRCWWLAFAPGGSYLGAYSTRERAVYALEQNTLGMLYRPTQFDQPEWPVEWPE